MNPLFKNRKSESPGRRRGVAFVYYGLIMVPIIIPMVALAVDLSWMYARKSIAQNSADAAALAGAWQLANFQTTADTQARIIAGQPTNGCFATLPTDTTWTQCYPNYPNYVIPNRNPTKTTVTTENPVWDTEVNPPVWRYNWYRVKISRVEPTFFAGIMGSLFRETRVSASATARFETLAELNIKGAGSYGVAPGPVNLSLFGPDGNYNNGDCYSVKKLPDGKDNPSYNPNGYDFTINVDAFRAQGKSTAYVQIFDPDCYNKSGANVGTTAVDEYRGSGEGTTDVSDATTTQYTLYDDNETPYNLNDDVVLKTASYTAGSSTDMIWNDFKAVAMSSLGASNMRLNVRSTAGSSENGFDLRVSDTTAPSRSIQEAKLDPFNSNNGTVITAQGHMPMNFNKDGTVNITLGVVPVQAAGGQLSIRKFDTDVGSKSVTYTCSTLPGQSWPGVLSSNGTFVTDTISVPLSYSTAGTWYASYTAGLGDTSVWDMSYNNSGPGKPGTIKLIR